MKRIAYIDHSYHQKTKSTEFVAEFLKRLGEVEIYWDNSWSTGISRDWRFLNAGFFDLIVFFQILPSKESLRSLSCRSILLIPMYDSVGDVPLRDWIPFRKYSFLSFSEKIHHDLRRLGISSFRLQFFPDPQSFPAVRPQQAGKVFFWERTEDVSVAVVEHWFEAYPTMKFHHHESLDPGKPQGPRRVLPTGWGSSQWFETREAYQAVVDSCNVYLAPRRREGIGMSFLEAMARGMAVVGWDHPTLSEYVCDGENGVLLREKEALAPNLDWGRLGQSARRSVEVGYRLYQERLPILEKWMLELMDHPHPTQPRIATYFAWSSWVWKTLLRNLKRSLVTLRDLRR